MRSNLSEQASVDLGPLQEIVKSYQSLSSSDLIPLLQQIQDAYGYLSKAVLMEMSKRTGIAASRIYGVATFYEQFYFEPRGRHTVKCCRGTACHVREGTKVIDAIKAELNIQDGETTEDKEFTFETVACLGVCALAPVIVIDGAYHGQMTPGRVKTVLAELSAGRKEAN